MNARWKMLPLLLLFACLPQAARSHAVLLSAEPADGARLERAPAAVTLQFNEPVTPVIVRVQDRRGAVVADSARAENETVRIPLPAALPPGRYIVSYRVMSADSHPVAGALSFDIGDVLAMPSSPPPAADAGDQALGWTVAYGVARGIFYLALLLTVGGFMFRRLAGDHALVVVPLRSIAFGVVVAAFALAIGIGLKGAQLVAGPAGALFAPAVWGLGASTTLGPSALVACVGLALILMAARTPGSRWLQALGWLGVALACASVGMTGHAATAPPRWLSAPVVALHVLAASFWIGALLPLRRALDLPTHAGAAIFRRFSRTALGVVAIVLGAGLLLAVLQVESVEGLLGTIYGGVLIGKAVVVAGLLAVAAHNKLRWTPRLAGGDPGARAALRQLLNLDIALALLVVVATAALGQVTPPRARPYNDASENAKVMDARTVVLASPMGEGRTALLEIGPARVGRNVIVLRVLDAEGRRLRPIEIRLELSLPAASLGPLSRAMTSDGDGRFTLDDDTLSAWGTWKIDAHILLTEFRKAIVNFDLVLQ